MSIPLKQYGLLLTKYLQPQQKYVIGLLFSLLVGIALQLINPQILGYFIDTSLKGDSQQGLLVASILFIAFALLTQILAILTTYLGETVAWTATNALRLDLTAHCLHLDLAFHKQHPSGELIERVDGDVNALSRFFSQLVIHIFGNAVLVIGILVVLWLQNQLAGIILSVFAILALTVLLKLRSIAIMPWSAYRQINGEFHGTLGEQIVGREDLKGNGAVGYAMAQFHQILRRWLPIYHQARLSSTLLWISSVGLFTLGNAIALAVSIYLWQSQSITIGTAYLIFHYTNLLSQPIEKIREEIEQLQQVEASIYRIHDLLARRSAIQDHGQNILATTACDVTFDQVYFRYGNFQTSELQKVVLPPTAGEQLHTSPYACQDSEWTLQNISFALPAGQTLGILGKTGSGKSTITRLLLRLYDIQSGKICLDHQPIREITMRSLRDRIGFVTQDVQLFQATIKDNLTFFDHSISESLIHDTIEELGLAPWLRSLPDGLHTQITANQLSAGQSQLLALARVFLKNPSLVILDEASSRLDPETERLLEHSIGKLLAHRTAIIIAHRLQTLQKANQILILDQGKILEYGDRLSLLNQPNSHFNRLSALTGNTAR